MESLDRQAPPISIHKPKIDLTPTLIYVRSIVSHYSTSVSLLQQKLAFLLAMAALLRPSDLVRIPFSSCKVDPSDGCRHFKVIVPKVRRRRRRIIKDLRVHPHQDQAFCPVYCFTVLRDHPHLQGRMANSLLFLHANNIRKPVVSHTISSWLHHNFISKCTTESCVSIRSLASFTALGNGVSLQDIVSPGNWASSDTFQQYYQ
ncbi:uncharacterized protein RHIMIDRAFT_264382 [Rhizopus microsporus ATCC 52813]|uniref:Tyr recombinase domain-containing protein n=1 Tax=Rhizopus microsporus ATCC 52813 TaxID=1340429 RepID=A0A2G4T4C5_RHIZD|nr:uncharacterized protein RHIMIDRAFT_264382 [Rhizopus microsporus ATCC 52813]PHZ15848.1 hypothetical protein RHIMIDRAFT_264382 [Rhizopus microsporus ATCC 52813]